MVLSGGPEIPFEGLAVVTEDTEAARVHGPEAVLRVGIALPRGPVKPSHRLAIVLRGSQAAPVQLAEAVLRLRIVLIRGKAVPFERLRAVPRDAKPVLVHPAEAELGAGVALIRGLPVPAERLRVVLRQAVAVEALLSHDELQIGIALAGPAEICRRVKAVIEGLVNRLKVPQSIGNAVNGVVRELPPYGTAHGKGPLRLSGGLEIALPLRAAAEEIAPNASAGKHPHGLLHGRVLVK